MFEKHKILVSIGLILGIVISVYGIHQLYIESEANRIDRFKKHAGYYVLNEITSQDENNGDFTLLLNWKQGKKEQEEPSSPVIKSLKVIFTVDSQNECQFKITDLNDSRFQLPNHEPFPYTKVSNNNKNNSQRDYYYEISKLGERFYFKLFRKSTNEIIFSTQDYELLFTDKYLEISTSMQNEMIFGLGDRRTDFILKSGKYSFWNADAMWIDNGKPGKSIYGYHPMYLQRDTLNNLFHVVLFRNAYGLQVDYSQNSKLTYKTIGGVLDFKFFLGDTNPENTIKLYHNYINGWILHPFWVQGFHQCRWGYKTSKKLNEVWDKYNELQIPIDSLWSDIDYMYKYYDFTIDETRFNITQMKTIYNLTDPKGVHWSSIIDVGISVDDTTSAQKGIDMDIFIKSGKTNKPLVGKVWPGKTYFPDFNHPNSTQYWYEGLNNLTKYGIQQDGIWIDMNEYSNFVTGELIGNESEFSHEIKTFLSKEQPDLPFNPLEVRRMDHRTLSLDAKHYSGNQGVLVNATQNYTITQYDMHNINGFGEGLATYKAAKALGKKLTFILSRSTMFGSGRYVQHWNGDAFSTWEYLRLSIPSIMNFQMYGIPFNGDDICGLALDATAELCARWQQLGSLYPFSRNHNGAQYTPQEPYYFVNHPYVLSSTIKTLNISLFVINNGLGTVFRPLFWQYPSDKESYENQFQFMLGDYLLAAPVVEKGNKLTQTTKSCVYIPQNSVYYNFYDQKVIFGGRYCYDISFDAVVPLYIRSGKILHLQDRSKVLRSRFLDNKFTLMIALDNNNQAVGQMLSINDYNSDDNIINSCMEGNNCVINITANVTLGNNNKDVLLNLNVESEQDNTVFQEVIIDKIILAGIQVNGEYLSKTIDFENSPFVIQNNKQQFNLNIQI